MNLHICMRLIKCRNQNNVSKKLFRAFYWKSTKRDHGRTILQRFSFRGNHVSGESLLVPHNTTFKSIALNHAHTGNTQIVKAWFLFFFNLPRTQRIVSWELSLLYNNSWMSLFDRILSVEWSCTFSKLIVSDPWISRAGYISIVYFFANDRLLSRSYSLS